MADKIIVYGSSTLALMTRDIINESGNDFIGFVDDFLDKDSNEELLGTFNDCVSHYSKFKWIIAVGDNSKRAFLANRVLSSKLTIANVIHPLAYISTYAELGHGNIVFPFTYIGRAVKIGDCNVFMPNSIASHDLTIEDYSFFAPNVSLAGFTEVRSMTKFQSGTSLYAHEKTEVGQLITKQALLNGEDV